jgi:cation diffusion facilitator family transporter
MHKHPQAHTNDLFDDHEAGSSTLRAQAAARSTWVSVAVNLCLATAQVLVGLFAKSHALVADGLHSLSDLLSDFVVLVANRFSGEDSDDNHHYGHYRYENAASLIIGLILLLVASAMLYQGVLAVLQPERIAAPKSLALWVAGVALVAKELLFRYLLAVAQRVRSSMLVANAWHARSDAASSLVALAGIGGSLLGWPIFDPIAAIIVGLFVLRMGLKFTWSALDDLMDRAATEEENAQISALIRNTPNVEGLHDMRTRRVGDLILVDAHIEVDGALTVRQGHDIALAARNRVLTAMPQVLNVMTHIDAVQAFADSDSASRVPLSLP